MKWPGCMLSLETSYTPQKRDLWLQLETVYVMWCLSEMPVGSSVPTCNPDTSFYCPSRTACLPNAWKCDGTVDCPGGIDEPATCPTQGTCNLRNFVCPIINVSPELEMTYDGWQKCGNLCYAIMYNVNWANQKTETFEYYWVCALAMFDVISFPSILSGIWRHFKFRYVMVIYILICATYLIYSTMPWYF